MRFLLSSLVLLTASCAATPPLESAPAFKSSERPTSSLLLENIDLPEGVGLESGFGAQSVSRELTEGGLALLKQWEGEIRCDSNPDLHCPYNDVAGYCTIGHGHLLDKKSCSEITARLVELNYLNGITDAKATEILKRDLSLAQGIVEAKTDKHGKIGTTVIDDNQYDALVSFTFNVGGRNFNRSTLLKRLQSRKTIGGNADIEFEFSRWVRSGGVVYEGLKNRRKAEAKHFFLNHGLPSEMDGEEAAFSLGEDVFVDIQIGE
ncbi:MAG: lysozyme [Pseudomonadota bacterium]